MQYWHMFLHELQRSLEDELSLRFVLGAEIEFFISVRSRPASQQLVQRFAEIVAQCDLGIESFRQEAHPLQYEVSFAPLEDAALLAEKITAFRKLINTASAQLACSPSFLAKPQDSAPGNGMHIHLHLEGAKQNRLFAAGDDSQQGFNVFASTIAGLCATMNEAMVFFAPCTHAFARIQRQSSAEEFKFCGAPQTISWGNNNRTCAIRIPDTPGKPENRRIEHRAPGACSNPYACIASIIAGAATGIRQQLPLSHPRTQSDAREILDGLPRLARSRDEAAGCYLSSQFLHREFFPGGRKKYLPLVQHLFADMQR